MTKANILAALESPGNLETLYRSDPEQFRQSFPEAFAQQPNALVKRRQILAPVESMQPC
jgi:hypothetical protein